MNFFLSIAASSVVQLVLFTFIPALWWAITARKDTSFFQWIGLIPVPRNVRSRVVGATFGVWVAFLFVSLGVLILTQDVASATSPFSGRGIAALPAILVYATITTALSEEILFRGFLLKRIAVVLGFARANILQALLFGAVHGLLLLVTGSTNFLIAATVTFFTALVGWALGFLNERLAQGSILPSWTIHALSNIVSGLLTAYSVFS
ncbi:MAG: CPBP family intramembrane metalloprotease [Actinobacteria bacterium]|nr:MAG: CPBP family intramembrane metalloprotease [Actinomycetota bacterium]